MKITSVTEQKKNKERVNIFLDGKFSFGLHTDVYLDFRLKVGVELDEARVVELKTADAFRQSFDKAVGYLSSRPRSSHEVEQHLRESLIYKNSDYTDLDSSDTKEQFRSDKEMAIVEILAKLVDKKYIDDAAFAKWWISNRRQFRPRGKRMLLLELKAKGVSDGDIELALTTPNEEGHFNSEAGNQEEHSEQRTDGVGSGSDVNDEVELAVRVAEKYGRKYMSLEEYDFKQKVGRYLAGKGFDWDVIEVAIKIVRSTDS